jgi:pSer/pThr/pTyr-binding forkhead associated (FHA) protein
MFKLVIQDDEGKTTVVPLIRDEITIGRKEGNTIRLTERNVSRRHARILRNNGEVQIEDLGSYNGIRVNNARIAERVSLRVSDQVQIGDYKLYLKAEGVEQVDDARTMPIERIDAPATEVMPAISAPATTAPMPAATPIAATPAPQAVRTPAATADTDPGGRPVATAAQVAALTQPTGYGKLVVISSNFAGKELELTRPQMIIGRTTENDLVIDHRSISRNHAKVTRDTETGRYTISDLQSSNGVRVNGQDYGKVELRRGDTVDLGHVRLRFVEPGEDWLFSRDAVIADVPESGGNKTGLWIALALIVLAGGAAVFFLFGRSKDNGGGHTDNGSNDVALVASGGSNGSAPDVVGPGSQVAMVQTIDAAVVETNPTDEGGRIKVECLQDINDKKWTDATTCADRLGTYDKDKAKELKARARQELQNQLNVGKLDDAIHDQDLTAARKALKEIDGDSVYRKESEQKVTSLEDKIVDGLKPSFEAAKHKGDCKAIQTALTQAKNSYGAGVADRFSSYKCEVVATNPGDHTGGDHNGGDHPHNPGTGSATQPPPPASCDADDFVRKGTDQEGIGQHVAALAQFESAMKCKNASMPRLNQMAFMAACNAKSVPAAKRYWARLTPPQQTQLLQMCVRWQITRDMLEK